MTNVSGTKDPWIGVITVGTLYGSTMSIWEQSKNRLSDSKVARLLEGIDLAIDMVATVRDTLANYGANSPQRVKDLLEVLFGSNFLDNEDHTVFANLKLLFDILDEGLKSNFIIKVGRLIDKNGQNAAGDEGNQDIAGYVRATNLTATEFNQYKTRKTDHVIPSGDKALMRGNIHIDDGLLHPNFPIHEIAETIIHEASHRYCMAEDLQYVGSPEPEHETAVRSFKYMRPDRALHNADTIARFCQYLTVPDLENRYPLEVLEKPQGLSSLGPSISIR